jgi:transposase-like protein
MSYPISKEIKDQILDRVREGKESVTEIAKQHGLSSKTIYGWMSHLGTSSPLIELNKLKRENTYLKGIIGNLMLQMERGKKGHYG